MTGDLRVALIGYGHAGAVFHAPLIRATPGLQVTVVVTRDPERQARARRDVSTAVVVDTAERVWERAGDLDLVVIAVPNRFHVPLARAALAARLPTVVDKPLAPDAGAARLLMEAFARAHVLLTVFHNRRWDGDFLTVQRLVRDDRLGPVHRFESRFERWRPALRGVWREWPDPADGGGLLLDLGSHLIDQSLLLFGSVSEVYAELDARRDREGAEDDAFVSLVHASGVRSHLWMSALAASPAPRYRVLGRRGAFTKYGEDGQESALRAGARPGDAGWGQETPDRWGWLETDGGHRERETTEPGAYDRFYSALSRALREGTAPPVEVQAAVDGLEVIEAARHAAATGCRVRRSQPAAERRRPR
ncbi:MAG TPA: Gfo/Idh/MocA family oxidoreductase [Vicinamibacterales bacterium]|nr:Gfo/Idh/MocA family oxidoreductase [Vicinamibacterales bacterium]